MQLYVFYFHFIINNNDYKKNDCKKNYYMNPLNI